MFVSELVLKWLSDVQTHFFLIKNLYTCIYLYIYIFIYLYKTLVCIQWMLIVSPMCINNRTE